MPGAEPKPLSPPRFFLHQQARLSCIRRSVFAALGSRHLLHGSPRHGLRLPSPDRRYRVARLPGFRHFETISTQRFVEFSLESIKLDDYITCVVQPKLNQKALNAIPMPIPGSLEEQSQVVVNVERSQEETQRLTHLYERKLAALEELKKSLLHQAFNGEL